MNKLTLSLFALFITLLGLNVNSASAYAPGCTTNSGYSTTTGAPCGTISGCESGNAFSSTTGQSCNTGSSNSSTVERLTLILKSSTLTLGMSGENIKTIQRLLKSEEYYFGKIDGKYGRITARAVRDFMEDNNISVSTVVPGATVFSVTVINPNGGGYLAKGTIQTISWQDTNNVSTHEIKLIPYGNSSSISYTIANTQGSSYDWPVGKTWENLSVPEGAYTIKVCQTGTSVCDASDSYFKITSAATVSLYHSADNNHDWKIDQGELDFFTTLYNYRSGTTRTGDYSIDKWAYDNYYTYIPGVSNRNGPFHSADTNKDWKISLLELTRVIELKNATGGYKVQAGTEDGFAPVTTVASTSSVTVLSPNGGEGYAVGTSMPISFTVQNLSFGYKYEVSLVGSGNDTDLGTASLQAADIQRNTFIVPNVPAGQYRIRVLVYTGSQTSFVQDQSNSNFYVFPSGCISNTGYSLTTGLPCSGAVTDIKPVSVSCTATYGFSPTTGGPVLTWRANVSDGVAPFRYSWSAYNDVSGYVDGSTSSATFSASYSSVGAKQAAIHVTDSSGGAVSSGLRVSATCSGTVPSQSTTPPTVTTPVVSTKSWFADDQSTWPTISTSSTLNGNQAMRIKDPITGLQYYEKTLGVNSAKITSSPAAGVSQLQVYVYDYSTGAILAPQYINVTITNKPVVSASITTPVVSTKSWYADDSSTWPTLSTPSVLNGNQAMRIKDPITGLQFYEKTLGANSSKITSSPAAGVSRLQVYVYDYATGTILAPQYIDVTITNKPVTSTTPSSSWTLCADEGGACEFSGTRQVRYGANDLYNYVQATDRVTCYNPHFPPYNDPAYGFRKHCDYSNDVVSYNFGSLGLSASVVSAFPLGCTSAYGFSTITGALCRQ